MFVIFDMSDDRKRIFEKYRKHETVIKRHDVCSSAPFFVARAHRLYPDFEELRQIAVRYGCALAADDICLPASFDSLMFTPQILPLRMLIKSAAQALSQKSKSNISVTVIDKNAKATGDIEQLVPLARSVRVITAKPAAYDETVSSIFNTLGAVVILSDNYSTCYGSNLIIAPDDRELDGFDYGKIIVYKKYSSQANVTSLNKCAFKYRGFDSEEYGVDSCLFLCALYETCGYRLNQLPVFEGAREIICE